MSMDETQKCLLCRWTLTTAYKDIHRPEDMSPEVLHSIEHFFTHYKDLEPGKWVKIHGWSGLADAKKEIIER